jgi:hypothetical protein
MVAVRNAVVTDNRTFIDHLSKCERFKEDESGLLGFLNMWQKSPFFKVHNFSR